jgi:hypothetical protein
MFLWFQEFQHGGNTPKFHCCSTVPTVLVSNFLNIKNLHLYTVSVPSMPGEYEDRIYPILYLNIRANQISNNRYYFTSHSKNYWVFGRCPSADILENGKQNISETRSVSVLGWTRGEDTTHLGHLERPNLSHWMWLRIPPNALQFSEAL